MVQELFPESSPLPEPSRRHGQAALAWGVIVLMASIAIWLQAQRPHGEREDTGERAGPHADLMTLELQARYLVGVRELASRVPGATMPQGADFARQAEGLDKGDPEQRLCFVILSGALAGPDTALDRLQALDVELAEAGVALTPNQERLRDILFNLFLELTAGRDAHPEVPESDRELLRRKLGWFGRLALAQVPGDQADRAAVAKAAEQTTIAFLSAAIVAFCLGLAGLTLLFLLLSRLATGRLPPGFVGGRDHGAIYAETFAVWMTLYVGTSVGLALAPVRAHVGDPILASGLAMLATVAVALAWPVIRGVPWATVRADIGWTGGPTPVLEPLLGIATYAMALPLLLVGLLLSLMLMHLQARLQGPAAPFAPSSGPSHPVAPYVLPNDWGLRIEVLILAAVLAPLVEETMFRGILYRHLRDVFGGRSRMGSFVISSTIVSFLFAVIHPQGWTTVPALMALAYAFALAREWRDSLLPAMVAHGISNGLVMSLLIFAVGE